jgi:hypothetical protein
MLDEMNSAGRKFAVPMLLSVWPVWVGEHTTNMLHPNRSVIEATWFAVG